MSDSTSDALLTLQAERDTLMVALEEVILAYEYCSADPYDRGWSSLDDAVGKARATLSEKKR